MKNYFLKNDVVEILNITEYQRWNLGEKASDVIIGMRFKINYVGYNNNRVYYTILTETTRNISGNKSIEVSFHENQLLLYNRSIINWIKYYYKKLIN